MTKAFTLLAAVLLFAGGANAAISTIVLDVQRMVCHGCEAAVRKSLQKVPGVVSVEVNLQNKRAVVSFDPAKTGEEALTHATREVGFPSSVLVPAR